jgi:hypothetical protein
MPYCVIEYFTAIRFTTVQHVHRIDALEQQYHPMVAELLESLIYRSSFEVGGVPACQHNIACLSRNADFKTLVEEGDYQPCWMSTQLPHINYH